jgi:fatty acid amide hydrolase 2
MQEDSTPLPQSFLTTLTELFALILAILPVLVVVPLRVCCRLFYYFVEDLFVSRKDRQRRFREAIRLPHPALAEPAVVVSAKIRDGTYSSEQVVRATVLHSSSVNSAINAIAQTRFDEAISEARAIDAALASDRSAPDAAERLKQRPPFFGVPCSIKECFSVKGIAGQSGGITARKNIIGTVDATCVARMKNAGFVIVHTSTTSELCMWYESHTPLFGKTRNVYDGRRIVGGSSGGEAALVSAGGVTVGLGSDIGGSIRMPAFFNGVFGHKPTGGIVPSTGQHPLSPYKFLGTGPITRFAKDLLPLMEVLAGDDGIDPACKGSAPLLRSLATPTKWSNITVYTVPWKELDALRPGWILSSRVEDSIRVAVDKAAIGLVRQLGCKGPEPFAFPEFILAFDLWAAALSEAPLQPKFAHLMGSGWERGGLEGKESRLWLALETFLWSFGLSSTTLPAALLGLVEHLPQSLFPNRHAKLVEAGNAFKERIHGALGSGLLVFPAHPIAAPSHDVPLLRTLNISYTAVLNVAEVPATSVPMGVDSAGIPIGVQIVSGRGNDRLTIEAAVSLEDAGLAGWTPPEILGPSWPSKLQHLSSKEGVGALKEEDSESVHMPLVLPSSIDSSSVVLGVDNISSSSVGGGSSKHPRRRTSSSSNAPKSNASSASVSSG